MKGFTICLDGKDFFIQTSKVNKTNNLAEEVIKKLATVGYDLLDNASTRQIILHFLKRADCEIKVLPNGMQICKIYGDKFNSVGPYDDSFVIIKEEN